MGSGVFGLPGPPAQPHVQVVATAGAGPVTALRLNLEGMSVLATLMKTMFATSPPVLVSFFLEHLRLTHPVITLLDFSSRFLGLLG